MLGRVPRPQAVQLEEARLLPFWRSRSCLLAVVRSRLPAPDFPGSRAGAWTNPVSASCISVLCLRAIFLQWHAPYASGFPDPRRRRKWVDLIQEWKNFAEHNNIILVGPTLHLGRTLETATAPYLYP